VWQDIVLRTLDMRYLFFLVEMHLLCFEIEEDGVYGLRGSVYMHCYMEGQAISKLRTGELDVKRIRLG
jgi:hypothetical protein